jgi:hypothetical protein
MPNMSRQAIRIHDQEVQVGMTNEERCEICNEFDCECAEVVAREVVTDNLPVLPQFQPWAPHQASSVTDAQVARDYQRGS